MKRKLLFASFLTLLLLLTGCATQESSIPINYRWATVEGSQLNEAQAGEQFYFNILVDDGLLTEAVPLKIKVSGEVQSGSLRFELRRPDGQPVWNSGVIEAGDFSINTEYAPPAGVTGTYTLGLVFSDNSAATYNLGWHAIKLGPWALLPGLGMIVISLAFVAYAALGRWLDWRYLGLGALFWVLTVALKFAFAIPVNQLVFNMLGVSYDQLFSPGNLAAYLYIGALTGIFEAGLAWLILSKIRSGQADWKQAQAFGIGFGVIEAFLLGLVALTSALAGIFAPDSLPFSTLGGLATNANLLMGLAPVVERLSVIFAHLFSCLLIFLAITSGESKWGWLAILYKTLLDTPAGFAAFWGSGTPEKIWALEAVIAVFGLVGLWGTIQLARRYPIAKHNTIEAGPTR